MSDYSEYVHDGLRGRPGWRGGGLVTDSLRPVAVPFVAAAPRGARVRARLRLSPEDEPGEGVPPDMAAPAVPRSLRAPCPDVGRF